MAATFALVASLAAVGGGWAVRANEIGRWAALALLALFGLALVFPALSDRLTRPLVALGSRMSERAGERESIGSSAVLGVATGLLWAPCAGPILGIIFTAAAVNGASFNTSLLLLAYALGAATSLALALLLGGAVFARMKKSLGASERIRRCSASSFWSASAQLQRASTPACSRGSQAPRRRAWNRVSRRSSARVRMSAKVEPASMLRASSCFPWKASCPRSAS
jgi:hypothetical protein